MKRPERPAAIPFSLVKGVMLLGSLARSTTNDCGRIFGKIHYELIIEGSLARSTTIERSEKIFHE
jgi:hypothetical protein